MNDCYTANGAALTAGSIRTIGRHARRQSGDRIHAPVKPVPAPLIDRVEGDSQHVLDHIRPRGQIIGRYDFAE